MTETQTSTPGPMEQALENYLGPIDEPVGRFGTRSLRAQLNDVAREQDDIQRALVAALDLAQAALVDMNPHLRRSCSEATEGRRCVALEEGLTALSCCDAALARVRGEAVTR